MNTVKTFNSEQLLNLNGEIFIEDLNLKVWRGLRQIRITDLSNAMKTGKTVTEFTLENQDEILLLNFLHSVNDDLKGLFNVLADSDWEKDYGYTPQTIEFEGQVITVYRSEHKGMRQFSPFANLKPLEKEPKKWTLTHAVKALLNGQYDWVKCSGRYTDDYAFDAAYNYCKGEIDAVSLAKRLIESPSGWRAYEGWGGENVINICCHSFDNNEMKLNLSK